jgi:hypothetical protein
VFNFNEDEESEHKTINEILNFEQCFFKRVNDLWLPSLFDARRRVSTVKNEKKPKIQSGIQTVTKDVPKYLMIKRVLRSTVYGSKKFL